MATLVITHAGKNTTIEDPDFAEVGAGELRVGSDAALKYVNWLGDDWEEETSVQVGDKTYQGCTADLQPDCMTVYYSGVRTKDDDASADESEGDEAESNEAASSD